MRTAQLGVGLVAAMAIVAGAGERASAAPPPASDAKPVPYAQSQPVPYGQAQPPPRLEPLPTTPAPNAPAGSDVIYLKGGGMLRGTLVEMLPNDHATLNLSNGQSAIVEWGRIDHIERQGSAPNVVVVPPPSTAPAVLPAAPSGGTVWVHVEVDRDVRLESQNGGAWSTACSSPCDMNLPIDRDYRIVGDGVRRSAPFRITGAPGQKIVINVSPSSKAGFVGGIVLAGVGGFVAVIGLLIVAAGSISTYGSTSDNGVSTTGWTVTLVGAVGLTVGIVLIAGNAHTGETQEPLVQGAPPHDAWLRLPTWRDATPVDPSSKPLSFPIFSRSF